MTKFELGERITHPIYGPGWVSGRDGSLVEITFDRSIPGRLRRRLSATDRHWRVGSEVKLGGPDHYVWHDDQIWQVRFNGGFELCRDGQCIEDVSLKSYPTAKRDDIAEGDWVRIDDAVHLMCGQLTPNTTSKGIFEVRGPITNNVYGRYGMVLVEACKKVMDARLARALAEVQG